MSEDLGPGHETNEPRQVRVTDRRKVTGDAPAGSDAATSGGVEVDEAAPSELDELGLARAQAAGYLDDLQRLKAEFDNYRKRVLREQTDLLERGSVTVVARLLNVLDNLEVAVASAEETHDFDRTLKGIEMVLGELKEVLKGEGLEPMRPKGEPFDPHLHEAAVEIPGDGSGHLVVDEVLRPGYMFKGRVLRPAMVKVTQLAQQTPSEGDDG